MHCLCRRGLLLFAWLVPATSGLAAAVEPDPLLDLTNVFQLRLWDYSLDLAGAIGYKDNALLSATNRLTSAFWDTRADALVFRLPADGWMCNLIATAEDTHYFGGKLTQDDKSAVVAAQATRYLDHGWSSTLGTFLAYQDQVLDLSSIAPGQAGASRVVAETARGRWTVRREWGWGWGEVEAAGTRQVLEAPLDSFWQAGPKLSFGHRFSTNSEVAVTGQWNDLRFDSRENVTRSGDSLTNSLLRMSLLSCGINWRQAWDRPGHWSTTLAFSFESDRDNGSGYFNLFQYSVLPGLEYRRGRWKVGASLRASWFEFPVQMVGGTNNAAFRSKFAVGAVVRAECQITPKFKLFSAWTLDRSQSNLAIDNYLADSISTGVEWRF